MAGWSERVRDAQARWSEARAAGAGGGRAAGDSDLVAAAAAAFVALAREAAGLAPDDPVRFDPAISGAHYAADGALRVGPGALDPARPALRGLVRRPARARAPGVLGVVTDLTGWALAVGQGDLDLREGRALVEASVALFDHLADAPDPRAVGGLRALRVIADGLPQGALRRELVAAVGRCFAGKVEALQATGDVGATARFVLLVSLALEGSDLLGASAVAQAAVEAERASLGQASRVQGAVRALVTPAPRPQAATATALEDLDGALEAAAGAVVGTGAEGADDAVVAGLEARLATAWTEALERAPDDARALLRRGFERAAEEAQDARGLRRVATAFGGVITADCLEQVPLARVLAAWTVDAERASPGDTKARARAETRLVDRLLARLEAGDKRFAPLTRREGLGEALLGRLQARLERMGQVHRLGERALALGFDAGAKAFRFDLRFRAIEAFLGGRMDEAPLGMFADFDGFAELRGAAPAGLVLPAIVGGDGASHGELSPFGGGGFGAFPGLGGGLGGLGGLGGAEGLAALEALKAVRGGMGGLAGLAPGGAVGGLAALLKGGKLPPSMLKALAGLMGRGGGGLGGLAGLGRAGAGGFGALGATARLGGLGSLGGLRGLGAGAGHLMLGALGGAGGVGGGAGFPAMPSGPRGAMLLPALGKAFALGGGGGRGLAAALGGGGGIGPLSALRGLGGLDLGRLGFVGAGSGAGGSGLGGGGLQGLPGLQALFSGGAGRAGGFGGGATGARPLPSGGPGGFAAGGLPGLGGLGGGLPGLGRLGSGLGGLSLGALTGLGGLGRVGGGAAGLGGLGRGLQGHGYGSGGGLAAIAGALRGSPVRGPSFDVGLDGFGRARLTSSAPSFSLLSSALGLGGGQGWSGGGLGAGPRGGASLGGLLAAFGGRPGASGGLSAAFGGRSGSFGGLPAAFGGLPAAFGGRSGPFGGLPAAFCGRPGALSSAALGRALGLGGGRVGGAPVGGAGGLTGSPWQGLGGGLRSFAGPGSFPGGAFAGLPQFAPSTGRLAGARPAGGGLGPTFLGLPASWSLGGRPGTTAFGGLGGFGPGLAGTRGLAAGLGPVGLGAFGPGFAGARGFGPVGVRGGWPSLGRAAGMPSGGGAFLGLGLPGAGWSLPSSGVGAGAPSTVGLRPISGLLRAPGGLARQGGFQLPAGLATGGFAAGSIGAFGGLAGGGAAFASRPIAGLGSWRQSLGAPARGFAGGVPSFARSAWAGGQGGSSGRPTVFGLGGALPPGGGRLPTFPGAGLSWRPAALGAVAPAARLAGSFGLPAGWSARGSFVPGMGDVGLHVGGGLGPSLGAFLPGRAGAGSAPAAGSWRMGAFPAFGQRGVGFALPRSAGASAGAGAWTAGTAGLGLGGQGGPSWPSLGMALPRTSGLGAGWSGAGLPSFGGPRGLQGPGSLPTFAGPPASGPSTGFAGLGGLPSGFAPGLLGRAGGRGASAQPAGLGRFAGTWPSGIPAGALAGLIGPFAQAVGLGGVRSGGLPSMPAAFAGLGGVRSGGLAGQAGAFSLPAGLGGWPETGLRPGIAGGFARQPGAGRVSLGGQGVVGGRVAVGRAVAGAGAGAAFGLPPGLLGPAAFAFAAPALAGRGGAPGRAVAGAQRGSLFAGLGGGWPAPVGVPFGLQGPWSMTPGATPAVAGSRAPVRPLGASTPFALASGLGHVLAGAPLLSRSLGGRLAGLSVAGGALGGRRGGVPAGAVALPRGGFAPAGGARSGGVRAPAFGGLQGWFPALGMTAGQGGRPAGAPDALGGLDLAGWPGFALPAGVRYREGARSRLAAGVPGVAELGQVGAAVGGLAALDPAGFGGRVGARLRALEALSAGPASLDLGAPPALGLLEPARGPASPGVAAGLGLGGIPGLALPVGAPAGGAARAVAQPSALAALRAEHPRMALGDLLARATAPFARVAVPSARGQVARPVARGQGGPRAALPVPTAAPGGDLARHLMGLPAGPGAGRGAMQLGRYDDLGLARAGDRGLVTPGWSALAAQQLGAPAVALEGGRRGGGVNAAQAGASGARSALDLAALGLAPRLVPGLGASPRDGATAGAGALPGGVPYLPRAGAPAEARPRGRVAGAPWASLGQQQLDASDPVFLYGPSGAGRGRDAVLPVARRGEVVGADPMSALLARLGAGSAARARGGDGAALLTSLRPGSRPEAALLDRGLDAARARLIGRYGQAAARYEAPGRAARPATGGLGRPLGGFGRAQPGRAVPVGGPRRPAGEAPGRGQAAGRPMHLVGGAGPRGVAAGGAAVGHDALAPRAFGLPAHVLRDLGRGPSGQGARRAGAAGLPGRAVGGPSRSLGTGPSRPLGAGSAQPGRAGPGFEAATGRGLPSLRIVGGGTAAASARPARASAQLAEHVVQGAHRLELIRGGVGVSAAAGAFPAPVAPAAAPTGRAPRAEPEVVAPTPASRGPAAPEARPAARSAPVARPARPGAKRPRMEHTNLIAGVAGGGVLRSAHGAADVDPGGDRGGGAPSREPAVESTAVSQPPADLTLLVHQVYQQIKRELEVEKERKG